jgi:hypothetical protein
MRMKIITINSRGKTTPFSYRNMARHMAKAGPFGT